MRSRVPTMRKSRRLVKGFAGVVVRKDPGLDRPDASGFCGGDQGVQQAAAGVVPPGAGVHVDGVLDYSGVEHRSETGEAATQPSTLPPPMATNR